MSAPTLALIRGLQRLRLTRTKVLKSSGAAMAPWNLTRHQRGSSSRQSHQDSHISPLLQTSSPCPSSGGPAVISPAVNNAGESSSTDYDGSPSRRRRSFPVRSLSNQFPSLFSGRKKKDRRSDSTAELFSNSDFPGDDFYLPQQVEPTGVDGDRSQADMKEFASGNCMTCGSTMRWPKELDVFKCSICVTINDLVPLGTQKSKERRPRGQSDDAPKTPSNSCPPGYLYYSLLMMLHQTKLSQPHTLGVLSDSAFTLTC